MRPNREEVIKANIKLHNQLLEFYKKSEPHYRPENKKRVENILSSFSDLNTQDSLLDVGCGMGFIIDIAKNYFAKIRGIDVTETMLNQVDTKFNKCDIKVQVAEAEAIPFCKNSFNVVTAYAVLHHLHNLKPVFQEIYRVLEPGGIFYSDTDPNFYFWETFSKLPEDQTYNYYIQKEIDAVNHKDQELFKKYNIAPELLNTAEILKHDAGGFKAEELKELLKDCGFSEINISYEWYVGEARVIHSDDTKHAGKEIRLILNEMLPLTKHLFKYLKIVAIK